MFFNPELSGKVSLGSIGTYNGGIFESQFNEVGAPHLIDEVKINLKRKEFSKEDIRRIRNIGNSIDSLENNDSKKKFYSLEISIADEIEYVKAINNSEYHKMYLKNTNDGLIVHEIEISFPSSVMNKLLNAEEVYLKNNSKSAFELSLYSKNSGYERISFSDGVVIDFDVSRICWIQNYRNETEAAALISKGGRCPGLTKKNPIKLQKEESFDEFY